MAKDKIDSWWNEMLSEEIDHQREMVKLFGEDYPEIWDKLRFIEGYRLEHPLDLDEADKRDIVVDYSNLFAEIISKPSKGEKTDPEEVERLVKRIHKKVDEIYKKIEEKIKAAAYEELHRRITLEEELGIKLEEINLDEELLRIELEAELRKKLEGEFRQKLEDELRKKQKQLDVEIRKKAEDAVARRKALEQKRCAPIAKKIGGKRQELRDKQRELNLLKGRFDVFNRAVRGGHLPIRILITRGSIYDYTRNDRTVEQSKVVQRRMEEYLKEAGKILSKNGVLVKYEYIGPVVEDVGRILTLGALGKIGQDFGTPCMPVLVFADEIEPPEGEPRSMMGWTYSGLTDPENNVACITSSQYSEMRLGRHILHNLAHLLGMTDKKNEGSDMFGERHISYFRNPGTHATGLEWANMQQVWINRRQACQKIWDMLKKDLDQKKTELEKLRLEIERLEMELEDCLKKKKEPREEVRDLENVRQPCEALRYGWPELRRRYNELEGQVHYANDELDKAKEMLEEIQRLLLLMDECVKVCEESYHYDFEEETIVEEGEEEIEEETEEIPTEGDYVPPAKKLVVTEATGLPRPHKLIITEPIGPPTQPVKAGGKSSNWFKRFIETIRKPFGAETSTPGAKIAEMGKTIPPSSEGVEGKRISGDEAKSPGGEAQTPQVGQETFEAGGRGAVETGKPATAGSDMSRPALSGSEGGRAVKLSIEESKISPGGTQPSQAGQEAFEAGGRGSVSGQAPASVPSEAVSRIPSKALAVPKTGFAHWLTSILGEGIAVKIGIAVGAVTLLAGIATGSVFGIVELVKYISGSTRVETPAPVSQYRQVDLRCGLSPDGEVSFLELDGTPGYWWSVYFSTLAPETGSGDFLSSNIRLDLVEAFVFMVFEDYAEGYFDDSGHVRLDFPRAGIEPGQAWWFQAISAEDIDVLNNNPSAEEVQKSEVCEIDF
jgi:hypothetical protein